MRGVRMNPCPPSGPVTECCLLAIPNTSEWGVVCPGGATAPAVIPAASWEGLALMGLLLAVAGAKRLQG